MEPNFNLLDSFTGDTTAGEVKKTLNDAGLRMRAVGYSKQDMEEKRLHALEVLGDKWLLHPSRHVKREVVAISARGGK